MTINLDLVIQTVEDSVDMKAGLASMQGCSDAIRCVAESVLTEKVPERQTAKSSVRTTLKKSFKGSYGQIFSLDIHDEELKKKLNKIGHKTFIELIGYFISESLYRESNPISQKAQKIVDGLGDTAEKIVHQLRISALENIHEISTKFNHNIKIRHRISRDEQTMIAEFDRESATVLHAERSRENVDLTVTITRFNTNTGNGRLLIKGQRDAVAFGFDVDYRQLQYAAKKVFSVNLDYNNGLAEEKWKYLKISASPIKLRDERVVKYIVKGIYEN